MRYGRETALRASPDDAGLLPPHRPVTVPSFRDTSVLLTSFLTNTMGSTKMSKLLDRRDYTETECSR